MLNILEKYLQWRLKRAKIHRRAMLILHGDNAKKTNKAFKKYVKLEMELWRVQIIKESRGGQTNKIFS